MRENMNNDRSTVVSQVMLALVPAAVLWMASPLQAQSWVTPYRPARPALSPYLYLTRPDVRGFPNYQAFVEPLRDQRQKAYNQESRDHSAAARSEPAAVANQARRCGSDRSPFDLWQLLALLPRRGWRRLEFRFEERDHAAATRAGVSVWTQVGRAIADYALRCTVCSSR